MAQIPPELHSGSGDGRKLEVVAAAWPSERVLLSRDGGLPHSGPHGEHRWRIFDSRSSELRAAGFSPSGKTLALATSSDLSLWNRDVDVTHLRGRHPAAQARPTRETAAGETEPHR